MLMWSHYRHPNNLAGVCRLELLELPGPIREKVHGFFKVKKFLRVKEYNASPNELEAPQAGIDYELYTMPVISPLRPVTQKLNSVSVQDLPGLAHFLASSITNCTHILSSPNARTPYGSSDDALLVHKLRTRISSLLQDRTPQGRWTAIILVKAVVEAGGWEILKDCEPWARNLLSILGVLSSSSSWATAKELTVVYRSTTLCHRKSWLSLR